MDEEAVREVTRLLVTILHKFSHIEVTDKDITSAPRPRDVEIVSTFNPMTNTTDIKLVPAQRLSIESRLLGVVNGGVAPHAPVPGDDASDEWCKRCGLHLNAHPAGPDGESR